MTDQVFDIQAYTNHSHTQAVLSGFKAKITLKLPTTDNR